MYVRLLTTLMFLATALPASSEEISETDSKQLLRDAQQLSRTLLTASQQGYGLVEVQEPGLAFGSVRGYDAADVDRSIQEVRAVLNRSLARQDLAALQSYTQEFFPKFAMTTIPVPSGPATKCSVTPCPKQLANAHAVQQSLVQIQAFVDRVVSATAYRVTFTVRSSPSGAKFTLQPVGGGHVTEVATNGSVGQVFRGLYRYSVERQGSKRIEATINLVDNSPEELYCELVDAKATANPIPCLFGLIH